MTSVAELLFSLYSMDVLGDAKFKMNINIFFHQKRQRRGEIDDPELLLF